MSKVPEFLPPDVIDSLRPETGHKGISRRNVLKSVIVGGAALSGAVALTPVSASNQAVSDAPDLKASTLYRYGGEFGDTKDISNRSIINAVRTLMNGGWLAIRDLVRALPFIAIEHKRVDQYYDNHRVSTRNS